MTATATVRILHAPEGLKHQSERNAPVVLQGRCTEQPEGSHEPERRPDRMEHEVDVVTIDEDGLDETFEQLGPDCMITIESGRRIFLCATEEVEQLEFVGRGP